MPYVPVVLSYLNTVMIDAPVALVTVMSMTATRTAPTSVKAVESELDALLEGRPAFAVVAWDASGEVVSIHAGTCSWRVSRSFLHLALVSPASDGTTSSEVVGYHLRLTSPEGTVELQRGPVLAYLGSTLAVRSLAAA